MSQPRVFVTRMIPEAGLSLLRAHSDLHVWEDEMPPPADALRREAANAAGLLTMLTDSISADLIDAAPALKVISNYAVGYDNIDVSAATARGIPVGNTPDVLTETSADLAFALLLAAARRLEEGSAYVKAGRWRTWGPTTLLGQDVHGATLGIIGLGRIGRAVARRAGGFGMRILYYGGSNHAAARALSAEARSLDDLLRESDFISLHAPLKPETHHIIDARALNLMKPTAILINTGRGPLVDSAVLYKALKARRIAAAALDVTDPEPISPDDPLLTLPNCLIVPHIASASVATRDRMAQMAAENLLAGLRGEKPPHCVNPDALR